MLVLTRKTGESILLDGGIRITVLHADAGGARIGIEAPSDVGIFREEVLDRVAQENARAQVSPGEWEAFRSQVEGRGARLDSRRKEADA